MEHFHRLSFELSELLERHVAENISQPTEFVDLIKRCEQVHITTDEENHLAKQAKGDYTKAGIELVEWASLSNEQQEILWARKLKGQVCNAADFR